MMDKKSILIGSFVIGFGIYAVPMFVRIKWLASVCKPVGIGIVALGTITFIAYDVIMTKLTNTGKESKKEKELDKQYKAGELSFEEYMAEKEKITKRQIAQAKRMLELEQNKQKTLKLKQQIKTTKQAAKPKVNMRQLLQGDGPINKGNDMLSNLGALTMGNQSSKEDSLDYKKEMQRINLEKQMLKNEQLRQRINRSASKNQKTTQKKNKGGQFDDLLKW